MNISPQFGEEKCLEDKPEYQYFKVYFLERYLFRKEILETEKAHFPAKKKKKKKKRKTPKKQKKI